MKGFTSLIAAILLLSLFSVDANLQETCKRMVPLGTDFNFCITTLQVVPGSNTANTQGLAIMAAELTNTNYTHNLAKANELLNGKSLPAKSIQALRDCVDGYNLGITALKKVIEELKAGDYPPVNINLSAALNGIETCKDTWKEVQQTSPMAKEEDDASKMSRLALHISSLLH